MIKKTRNKLITSLLLAAMVIPAFSITAKAETIEIPLPLEDINGDMVPYNVTMDTSKTETYAQTRERKQNFELQRAAEQAASKDKTGYPFVKISAAEFLKDFGENGYRFDAARYAADYPDVAAVVGTSQEALWNHYKTVGIYEGRYAHDKLVGSAGFFDGISPENMWIVEAVLPKNADGSIGGGKLMISNYDWMIDFAKVYTPQMTDRQKVEWVNKWMCDHYYYGYKDSLDSFHPELFEKYGDPMECAGYAGVFLQMMRTLGIPTITDGTPAYHTGEQHEWNRVFVDGRWYVVDVTWNDNDREGGVEGPDNTNYLLIDRHPVYQLYDDVVGYAADDVTLKNCY